MVEIMRTAHNNDVTLFQLISMAIILAMSPMARMERNVTALMPSSRMKKCCHSRRWWLYPPAGNYSGRLWNLNDLAARIVKSTPEIPYIAISHVWIDGLGNPNANSLPVCQLARLRHLVEEVLSNFNRGPSHIDNIHRNPEKPPRPLFWLNTLLCPVGPPGRKKPSLQKIP